MTSVSLKLRRLFMLIGRFAAILAALLAFHGVGQARDGQALQFVAPSEVRSTLPSGRTLEAILSDRISVMDFCSREEVSRDISGCAQRAIDAAAPKNDSYGGKIVFFPAQYSPYALAGTLRVPSFVSLVGEGPQTSLIRCANGAADCIQLGSMEADTRNQVFRDLGILGVAKSDGAGISLRRTYRASVINVDLERMIVGVDVGPGTNGTELRDLVATVGESSSRAGIFWHSPTGGSWRSDVLALNNVVVRGNWSKAAGMIWDGRAYTTTGAIIRFLQLEYGLRVLNSARSKTEFPSFLAWTGFEAEGFTRRAISIEAGADFKFLNSDITNMSGYQGRVSDDFAIAILADREASITRGVQITNSRIGLSRRSGLYSEALNLQVANSIFVSTSMAGKGVEPVIKLAASARDSVLIGVICEEFGGKAFASSCLSVDRGARAISAFGFVTSYLNGPWLDDPGRVVDTGSVTNDRPR